MTVRYMGPFDKTQGFSDICAQFSLTVENILTYTVPGLSSQRYIADFGYNSNSNVFVGYNGTVAVPGANSTTSNPNVEYKPLERYVKGGDVLSFITPDATGWMGISLRSIPN